MFSVMTGELAENLVKKIELIKRVYGSDERDTSKNEVKLWCEQQPSDLYFPLAAYIAADALSLDPSFKFANTSSSKCMRGIILLVC